MRTPGSNGLSATALVTSFAAQREVHAAFQFFHLREPTIFSWQLDATLIPAPPHGEAARADWLRERFLALGLENCRIDSEGSCFGEISAAGAAADGLPDAPALLLSAHLDTVFGPETPLEPRMDGERTYLPGLADNGIGIAALLSIAAAIRTSGLQPATKLLFCGNVGEEGVGNLRGMRQIFFRDRDAHNIGAAIVLDGAGVTSTVGQALASRRYQVTVTGPGGHSWSDAANPNPFVALSRAIAAFTSEPLPTSPRTTVNFASVAGGDSINAIPESVTAAVDIRSEESGEIIRQEVRLYRAVEDAVLEAAPGAQQTGGAAASGGAGAASTTGAGSAARLTYSITPLGERPSGKLPEDSFLAQAVHAVDRHLQLRTQWRTASTDANIPLSLGIPAISVSAGGIAGGTHTLHEWFDPTGRGMALRRILLLTLTMASHLAGDATVTDTGQI